MSYSHLDCTKTYTLLYFQKKQQSHPFSNKNKLQTKQTKMTKLQRSTFSRIATHPLTQGTINKTKTKQTKQKQKKKNKTKNKNQKVARTKHQKKKKEITNCLKIDSLIIFILIFFLQTNFTHKTKIYVKTQETNTRTHTHV